MLNAIKHGLGNLLNGNGRDARQAFWYYVLFIYLVTTVLSLVFVMPLMMQSMFAAMQQGIAQGQGQDPEVSKAAIQAAMMDSMSEIMPKMIWMSIAVGVVMLLSLAAAFVRRLHDSGLSGLWALVPAACQAVSLYTMPTQLARMQEAMHTADLNNPMAGMLMMRGSMGAGQLLAWVAIGVVVVLGVRKSTPGPNQYGEAPFVA